MGGRGASSGMSDKGNPYGSQYDTILKDGNILFVKLKPGQKESLLETMTKGRVYVLVGDKGLKSIIYFDKNNKRSKRVDLDHSNAGKKQHTQHGYYGNDGDNGKTGATNLTTDEKKMVVRVLNLWDNYRKGKK